MGRGKGKGSKEMLYFIIDVFKISSRSSLSRITCRYILKSIEVLKQREGTGKETAL